MFYCYCSCYCLFVCFYYFIIFFSITDVSSQAQAPLYSQVFHKWFTSPITGRLRLLIVHFLLRNISSVFTVSGQQSTAFPGIFSGKPQGVSLLSLADDKTIGTISLPSSKIAQCPFFFFFKCSWRTVHI